MDESDTLVMRTAEIAANYVMKNRVGVSEIGGVISAIHATLAGLRTAPVATAIEEVFTPAVSVRKSLADPTKIISMIDGKPYAVLKRHLTTQGLTPAEYRTRYKLPADYPMTAPAYSEMRKAMAVKIGLGKGGKGRPKRVVASTEATQVTGRRRLGVAAPK